MKDISCPVGRKIYSVKCDDQSALKIQELATQMNQIVNQNAVKYRGLSDDNLFFITAIELLSQFNKLESQSNTSTIRDKNRENIDENVIYQVSNIISDIMTQLNTVFDRHNSKQCENQTI